MMQFCMLLGYAVIYFAITGGLGFILCLISKNEVEVTGLYAWVIGFIIAAVLFIKLMETDPRWNMIADEREVITEVSE